MNKERRIEKLRRDHNLEDFDCGSERLNSWLKKYGLQNQTSGSANTFLGLESERLIGFYSLAAASASHADTPKRIKKGLAHHPVPIMLIARLAVHKDCQKSGIGRALLKDAVLRTLNAAEIAGIRAIAVHAKDEKARQYYEQFDFEPSPTDPFHLFVLIKDIRRTLNL
jgi:GNAT superfamily N-acetyltransferase